MREQRFPRREFVALGILGFSFVMLAAGCGGSGNSQGTVTPSVAGTSNPAAVCAAGTGGVIYIPDGGSSPHGITIQPFEETNGNFITSCTQKFLTASSSITDLSISTYGDAVAVAGGGSQLVGLSGFAQGGSQYFTPFTQTTTQNPFTSVAIVPAGTFAIAVDNEYPAPGPTAGLIGVNDITGLQPSPIPTIAGATPTPTPTINPNATATAYDPAIVNPSEVAYTAIGVSPSASPSIYQSTALADPAGSTVGRASIAIGPDGETLLVRGDQDLLALQVTPTAGGYFFTYPAVGAISQPIISGGSSVTLGQATNLGYPAGMTSANYGRGLMAFSPASASRALIGGSNTSGSNLVTLLTAVPTNLSTAAMATYPIGSVINSVAISPNGNIAAVGSASGLTILSGVNGNSLTSVSEKTNFPNGITFTQGGTKTTTLTLANVISVGFSTDQKYLIVLASNTGSSPATASILAFAIDGNGVLSPPVSGQPAVQPYTLGGSISAPAADYMVVR